MNWINEALGTLLTLDDKWCFLTDDQKRQAVQSAIEELNKAIEPSE